MTDPKFALLDAPWLVRELYGARARKRSGQEDEREPSAVELQVLVCVGEDPDQRVEDIAQRLAIEKSGVSHALTRLEAGGLIEKRDLPGFTRRQTRHLTDAGAERVRELTARARELLQRLPVRDG